MSGPTSETLTFLFTDVKGSTALIQDAGRDGQHELIRTQELVRDVLVRRGGQEVDCAGDGFFVVFSSALDAVGAAQQIQAELDDSPIKVRIGMHTGHAERWSGKYMGIDVHRAARIAAAAHGGQILLSRSTRELVSCEVTDLGLHQLKDVVEPIHLYQVGSKPFAPVASLGRSNLPTTSTTFVGRLRELAALNRILDTRGARLVTLTGPGGIGKTRLATELARRRAARYPEGLWWIDLAAIGESQLVPEAISEVVGAHGELAQFIGQRRCALVLDNFEHLQGAAGFVGDLVRRCSNLVVIVTSRSPLRVTSEWRFAVEPLAESEAIALFCVRARAAGVVIHKTKPVVAVCRRVEHVPLALELAAAKTVVLGPSDLLSRLEDHLYFLSASVDDVPDRHRTLRATVHWSYELLDPAERVAFCQLAVFAGGWTPGTAQAVFGVTLDTIESLVRKSFVRAAHTRFGMLEVIREFGLEQLAADVERASQARRQHRDHFLALVEKQHIAQLASPANWGPSFQEIETEHQNIHAALRYTLQSLDGHAAGLRFCASLRLYWMSRSHRQEGLRACLLALAGRHPGSDPAAIGSTLWAAAELSTYVGNLGQAASFYEEALALFRERGMPAAEAMVVSDIGHLSYVLGDFDGAQRQFSRLMSLASDTRDAKLTANAHYGIARVALARRQTSVARDHLELALAGYARVGHRPNLALATLYRGVLAMIEADDTAEEHLRRALGLAREAGEAMIESSILRCLGDIEAGRGNHTAARVLLRESLLFNAQSDDMLELALGLRSAAMLCFREGEFRHGATLLGTAHRAGAGIQRLLEALLSSQELALADAGRLALGDDFERFERDGAAMTGGSAVELALRHLSPRSSGAPPTARRPGTRHGTGRAPAPS